MPKNIPIEDALDVQLACERSDTNAKFNVLVNGALVPVTHITLGDEKPQLVTAHLGEAFHVSPDYKAALERIAKTTPITLDELLDDLVSAVNIAREALGQPNLAKDDFVRSCRDRMP